MFDGHHKTLLQIFIFVALGAQTSCVLYEEAPPYSPTPCRINEYVQDEACLPCPKGTLRPAGDAINKGDTMCSPVLCEENQRVSSNSCIACNKGERNDAGDDASGIDTVCESSRCATNQRVQNNQCVTCDLGTSNAAGDLANGSDTQCDGLRCGENQYVSANMCLTCEPGTVRAAGDDASGGDTQCEILTCQANQRVQANQCVACPAGTTSQAGAQATGQDTQCEPVVCEVNQYVRANQCTSCPAGSTRPAGDLADGVDTQCDSTLCDVDQRVQSNACVPCLDGRINEPGDDAIGQDTFCVPFGFSDISAGGDHTCGVTVTGGVKCWGDNSFGQLGVSVGQSVTKPVSVAGLAEITMVEAGSSHTCAIQKDGTVWCWGLNDNGQLGVDMPERASQPILVPGITSAIKVAVGNKFSCALEGNEIKCWGWDFFGQLGTSEVNVSQSMPVKVESTSKFIDVDASNGFACGLTDAGNVECWGANAHGQFGVDSSTMIVFQVPVEIPGVNGGAKSFAIGKEHLCVIFDQEVRCIGDNRENQLGNDFVSPSTFNLTKVDTNGEFFAPTSIDAGGSHNCVLNRGGAVSCWGSNRAGQLGDGTVNTSAFPVRVGALNSGIVKVSLGSGHTCAMDAVGSVSCWGANNSGQLGIGTTSSSLVPVKVVP